jgi:GTP-binding protein
LTGENVARLFALIEKVKDAARKRIGTGVLNRLLRQAFEANPPPLVKGRRLKLFYATQPKNGGLLGSGSLGEADQSADRLREKASPFDKSRRNLTPPEFVLFVNDPHLITETYRRYLEARIREAEPYPGLPIVLTARARARDNGRR